MICPTDPIDVHALRIDEARTVSPSALVSVPNFWTKPVFAMMFPISLDRN
jgi:hypothetical protein